MNGGGRTPRPDNGTSGHDNPRGAYGALMTPEQGRAALLVGLLACAGLLFAFPVEPVMTTEVLFDDPVDERIRTESVGHSSRSQLVLRIHHDDGGALTSDLGRVKALMQLEQEALDGSNPDTSWEAEDIRIARIQTPFSLWEDAFASRDRNLSEATRWADVLQPEIEMGWCGNESTPEERQAFEATILLLPDDANPGVACPAFAGANASQPPAANELIWMVWLESDDDAVDWGALQVWADKVSENTEFEVTGVGVNMLFSKVRSDAVQDLSRVLIPSVILLGAMLFFGLGNIRIAAATLGGVILVVCAEFGALSALGHTFSVLDGIAIPIIMGVAVDGAFWYCKSSRDRDEVRSMLLIAMITTVAAVSLALFGPIRAQRSLALVMVCGIVLSWVVTRFLLEGLFLSQRQDVVDETRGTAGLLTTKAMSWSWPIALMVLTSIALVAPTGVDVFGIEDFLAEDDPALDDLEDLRSRYVLASTTVAWIVVDVDGDSVDDFDALRNLQSQLGDHSSVIKLDSGMHRAPLVIGIPMDVGLPENSTVDSAAVDSTGSLLTEDARLQRDGVTTGVAIAVLIDGEDIDAALEFKADVAALLEHHDLSGSVGGDLPIGAEIARTFEETRITQIVLAGAAIFIVAGYVVQDPERAARIAVGTIAVGIAVDGMASLIGGRGVYSAPAVLLGMGFAADYLSHASAGHAPSRADTAARWWSAASSVSVFVLLSFAAFPPAQDTGRLLTLSILFAVVLATCLAFHSAETGEDA